MGDIKVGDIPREYLSLSPVAQEKAEQILAVVSGLTYGEIAESLGAVLFSIGIADAWENQEGPAPQAPRLVAQYTRELTRLKGGSIYAVPGKMLLDLGQRSKVKP